MVVQIWALGLGLLCVLIPPAFSQNTLVSTGSVWKYLDQGFDPGAGWRTAAFDDASWLSGPAELGFGDQREATLVRQTNGAGVTNITFYFRLVVTIPDITPYTNLLLQLRRDDGAVVYLNGTEIFRSNMPLGPVAYATLAATTASDDGTGLFAAPVNPGLLRNGNNLLAVEVHQATTNSSDLTFDLALQANVRFQPPTVAITSPTSGASIGSADLRIDTAAADVDGAVAMVEFYANGALLGVSADPPFSYIASNVLAGAYSLLAVAIDTTGLSSTSAPVAVTVPPRLIPSGAAWKYLDDGSNPGATWMAPAFNDTGWSNGLAQLGFGDGDEATRVQQYLPAPNTNTQVTAYYFRRAFDVTNTAGISNLALRVIRDDGAVVYLNGTEVFRLNMPAGPVSPTTFAVAAIGNDNLFHCTRVSPALLVQGRNVLAAEIHQANATSSDVSFDAELRPNTPFLPPSVSLVAPTNNALFFGPTNMAFAALAADADNAVSSVAFYLNNVLRGTDTTDSYDVDGRNYTMATSNIDAGTYTIRAVATDAGGLSATSAPVAFNVAYAPVISTLIATGSVWKYLDTGVDQGTAWRGLNFDDGSWATGTAKFGTNDAAATIIHITPINENITAYFRHRFNAVGAASYTNLAFRCLRDDGVVAFLNGVEVFRSNMPTGLVLFATPALSTIGPTNESYYVPISTNADALINGANVLAVELHQSLNTTDAGFDLGLVGVALPSAVATALNIQLTPSNTILSWLGTGYTLQDSTNVAGPYANRASGTNYYALPAPAGTRFFRLIKP